MIASFDIVLLPSTIATEPYQDTDSAPDRDTKCIRHNTAASKLYFDISTRSLHLSENATASTPFYVKRQQCNVLTYADFDLIERHAQTANRVG
jgi:hypothetical protein